MDRITAAKVLAAVAENGSFTAAADKLDMSKAMVTRHIALLEQWLGARLLQRTTRHVSLTAAGEQALRYCRELLALTEAAEAEIAPSDGELKGSLRLTSGVSLGVQHLSQAVAEFGRLHPKLNIHLNVGDQALNLVENGIDLAIRISSKPDDALIARPLAPCHSLLVAAPDYLAEYGEPERPEDLAEHRCLAHSHLNRSEWTFYRQGTPTVLTLDNALTGNDALMLLNAVLHGAGIAMLPRYLLAEPLAEGRLKTVLPDWDLPEMTVYALYPSRRQLPRAVRQF
ncbi:MAG: LysR family transcriptional regulator, partial [Neisseria sp.]|nr:LysR family transcriptional regulator [Neisseria sp.]